MAGQGVTLLVMSHCDRGIPVAAHWIPGSDVGGDGACAGTLLELLLGGLSCCGVYITRLDQNREDERLDCARGRLSQYGRADSSQFHGAG